MNVFSLAVCAELKAPASDCAYYTWVWLWCITQTARLHQPPPVKPCHMLRLGLLSTPSQYGCLVRWAPHRHQLEKGYLVLLLAGCLPGSKEEESEHMSARDDFWGQFNSTLLPTICPLPTQCHHHHYLSLYLQIKPSVFQRWPSSYSFPLTLLLTNKSVIIE